MLAILVIASTAILLVDFQLKLKGREENADLISSSPGSATTSPLPRIDGTISRSEYEHLYRDPDSSVELFWRIDESRGWIYFGLRCPLQGRVAISLEPTGPRMKGGDILVAYVKEDQINAQDAYADQLTNQTPDLDLGGTDDILEKAGSLGPQGTTVELVRPLATSDGFDKPITQDKMRIQLACSELANFIGLYADSWSTIEINFYTGEPPAKVPAP